MNRILIVYHKKEFCREAQLNWIVCLIMNLTSWSKGAFFPVDIILSDTQEWSLGGLIFPTCWLSTKNVKPLESQIVVYTWKSWVQCVSSRIKDTPSIWFDEEEPVLIPNSNFLESKICATLFRLTKFSFPLAKPRNIRPLSYFLEP